MNGEMFMISGKDLWDTSITRGMEEREVNGRLVYTYANMPSNPYEMLLNTTNNIPNKNAFCDNWNRVYTYGQFLEMVDSFAYYLMKKKDIKKGNHVGLLLHNSIEFCTAFYAIAKLGAVCVPFPTKYREGEVCQLIEKAGLHLIIANEEFDSWIIRFKNIKKMVSCNEENGYGFSHLPLVKVKDHTSYGSLEDKVIIMFTSGTTSQSKGVVLRNYNVAHAVITYQRMLDIKPWDKTIIPIPIYHITGLVALLNLFVYCGASVYLYKRYDAIVILQCIEEHGITFMHGSPTVFSKLLDYQEEYPNMKSLRLLGCGSSYTPLEKLKAFHKWLPHTKFIVIYGMSETSSPALLFPNDTPTSIYAGAAGKPIAGMDFKVLNEQGTECAIEEVGEIWIRGANVCEEYYQLESSAIVNGWLDTGDMGYYNEDNYIYVVDRKKDMINRGGEKIWCIDVEEEINAIEGVEECAVVGIPDQIYGEVAAAVVVLKENYTYCEDEIKARLKGRLARFKIPEKILFVEAVFKTPGLKVDKKRIRTLFL